jgi:DEAD/DEAH box helicase domain-containing protein
MPSNEITRTEPPRKAEFGEVELDPIVKDVFASRGISKLYKHQAEAIKAVKEGRNVVVTAPTASGKSEIYMSAIIEAALAGRNSLVLYPTKALSRDQSRRFGAFSLYGIRAEIYDGDTPASKREKIRTNPPNILITNVDMLHFILLNNRMFDKFFDKLEFVVLDELHTYSGVLGAHTANILLRLKRIAAKKRRKLRFISTSATVGNARVFAEELFGENFVEISGESSPRSEIRHRLIAPDEESYLATCAELVDGTTKKTLIFGNSHSVVERLGLIAKRANLSLRVYRSGLKYEKRKEIEDAFRAGKVKVLATTSALELGMDIGDVDSVILAGFPGTITRVRQRIGRAGRKGQTADAIFVARENPLDAYYFENPEEYFNGTPESCYVNRTNANILKAHLVSMAKDAMLDEVDEYTEGCEKALSELVERGLLKKWGKFYAPTIEGAKFTKGINIRSIGNTIRIYDEEMQKFVGERDEAMAINELFEGAIYLHGGMPYLSEKLDLENKIAHLKPYHGGELNEYSSPLRERNAVIVEEMAEREMLGHKLHYGRVHITDEVYGYQYKDSFSGKTISEHKFETPYIHEFDTFAIWLDIDELVGEVQNFGSGLHAFEHVSIAMMPAITGADSKEIGGISYPYGRMFVYDGVPDGNGVTNVVYNLFEKVVEMTKERLRSCKCKNGCPKCILDPQCGNNNRFLDKAAGLTIANTILKK